MDNKRLNKEASELCLKLSDELVHKLCLNVLECSLKNGYSDFNLAMNVLVGSMVRLMTTLEEELREDFISMIIISLTENLENLRKQGR